MDAVVEGVEIVQRVTTAVEHLVECWGWWSIYETEQYVLDWEK